jgi:hypothetical protein
LAQKLGQLQPFIAVFPNKCMANLHLLGRPDTLLARPAGSIRRRRKGQRPSTGCRGRWRPTPWTGSASTWRSCSRRPRRRGRRRLGRIVVSHYRSSNLYQIC